jgi:type II secretory pathway component GspD/PulD (secretin)
LKDVKAKSKIGIPILSKIPILGMLVTRETTDTEKIDLLIFIHARILTPGEFTEEQMQRLMEKYTDSLAIKERLRPAKTKKSKSDKAVPKASSPNQGYVLKKEEGT